MTKIALLGATGRMGLTLIRAIGLTEDLELSGALAAPEDPAIGEDPGSLAGMGALGLEVCSRLDGVLPGADVAVDFTLPSATAANVGACAAAGLPMVMGTTGLEDDATEALELAARQIAVMHAPNMSVGVNLCLNLAELAARTLGDEYDIDIVEAHHRYKIDAPSGTALKLGEMVARGRGVDLAACAEHGRYGKTGERERGTIAFSSIRAGDTVGEHSVVFSTEGERIEITHKASDRMTFAQGALRAARWIVSQGPGRYGMADVLGFESFR